jgi:hypothetical protein
MNRTLILAATALLFSASAALAAKNYQVTGPVTAIDDKSITVEKGKEKWEIARGTAVVPTSVKVGSKVTIEYNMTAAKVTDKAEKK